MDHRETLLADLDTELAATRRLLARVPQAALSWRPHEKSFSLGGLAAHLAGLPEWGARILTANAYESTSTEPGTPADAPPDVSVASLLDTYDARAAEVRRLLLAAPTALLDETWSLRRDGYTILTLPRGAAVRRFLLHHLIHHRGQLTVYLRLLGVPLPPVYGPTADEPS